MEPLFGPPQISNIAADGSADVLFRLHAPAKQRVCLVGEFNGWNGDADPMSPDDSGNWTITKRLPAGPHRYQFLVDGRGVADPAATDTAQPEDNPHRATAHAIVDVAKPSFQWQHDQWPRPAFEDLIIYEINIADFSADGNLAAIPYKLDYLAQLGVNAIEFLPIFSAAREEEWGYQTAFYFCPSATYGSADQFKSFIDEAHGKGIAVLLDICLAHSAHACPLQLMYDYDKSPFYGRGIGGDNAFGLPTFDHRKTATQAFVRAVQKFWLEQFHIDGFRYDYAINVGIDGDNGMPRVVADARAVRGDAYLIAEWLPEDPVRPQAFPCRRRMESLYQPCDQGTCLRGAVPATTRETTSMTQSRSSTPTPAGTSPRDR